MAADNKDRRVTQEQPARRGRSAQPVHKVGKDYKVFRALMGSPVPRETRAIRVWVFSSSKPSTKPRHMH